MAQDRYIVDTQQKNFITILTQHSCKSVPVLQIRRVSRQNLSELQIKHPTLGPTAASLLKILYFISVEIVSTCYDVINGVDICAMESGKKLSWENKFSHFSGV